MRTEPAALVRVLAALVFAATAAIATVYWNRVGGDHEVVDIARYEELGEWIASGLAPYRDFALEYPPGAIVAFLPQALPVDGFGPYYAVFASSMALIGAMAIVMLGRLHEDLGFDPSASARRLALVAVLPLTLGGVILTRFDLLPSLVVLLALALLVRGRERAAFLVLGAAIAIKLYPVVILPVLVTWVWKRAGRGVALRRAAEAVAVPVVAYAAFAVLSPRGVADSIWWQLSRPLQIESLASGVLLALHQAVGLDLSWSSSSGSQNLDGTAAGVLAALTSVLGIAALVAVWVLFARGEATRERLIRYTAAAVTAFIAFSKVFSPQYLVWLLFLVPLLTGPGRVLALSLLTGACVLTGLWFPGRYWALVREFDPLASWLVLPRGLLVVALLGVLLVTDSAREPARSPSPALSPRT